MAHIDVFNGDADGICALLQLRLAAPVDSELVTGVKRDISLLNRVAAGAGDRLTVLDVSLDKNRQPLLANIAAGAEVFYCDHHFAGDIPVADNFTARINTASDVCTSLLINGFLEGQFAEWAVVGAFGDNLRDSARRLAAGLDLDDELIGQYEKLGIYLNYNGYGADTDDLHFHPAKLYRLLSAYQSPRKFFSEAPQVFAQLQTGYDSDMQSASDAQALYVSDIAAVYLLPNEAWARRVSGVYSNDLANDNPDRAHAVLTVKANGNYLVSIRAPLNNKRGADEFCRQFATGGGRAAAAGINDLPQSDLNSFGERFAEFYREIG